MAPTVSRPVRPTDPFGVSPSLHSWPDSNGLPLQESDEVEEKPEKVSSARGVLWVANVCLGERGVLGASTPRRFQERRVRRSQLPA